MLLPRKTDPLPPPIRWLHVDQFATEFDVSPQTVRRWIQEGIIPSDLVQRAGLRRLRISAAAVATLRERFAATV